MMNAEFREWDFLKMEYFLRSKEDFYQYFYEDNRKLQQKVNDLLSQIHVKS